MESSFSVLWLMSTDCSTDLHARAAVAPAHARKPMRWKSGSPPLATTMPAPRYPAVAPFRLGLAMGPACKPWAGWMIARHTAQPNGERAQCGVQPASLATQERLPAQPPARWQAGAVSRRGRTDHDRDQRRVHQPRLALAQDDQAEQRGEEGGGRADCLPARAWGA